MKRTFFEVFGVVLAGRSANMLTPFGLGDAVVRVTSFDPNQRINVSALLVVAHASQTLPAVLFGVLSIIFLVAHGVRFSSAGWLITLYGVSIVLCLAAVFLLGVKFASFFYRIKKSFLSLEPYEWMVAVLLSVLRYIIFSAQLCFLFVSLGFELDFHIMLLGIFWIFLIKTIIPISTVLGDLIQREFSALFFFSFFSSDLMIVSLAISLIWLINIILPALFGIFFISKHTQNIT